MQVLSAATKTKIWAIKLVKKVEVDHFLDMGYDFGDNSPIWVVKSVV